MKVTFHNLTGVSRRTIAAAVLALFISGATYGTPRISTITFTPSTLSACIPASGNITASFVMHAVRGQNGTINGVYVISELPAGVTADFIPGFTSTGNNPFPDRTLTLHISSSVQPGSYPFSVRLYNSQGVTDQATVTGTLILSLAPSFTSVPSSILTNNDAGICGATVNYNATAAGYPAPAISYTFSGATTGSGNSTGSGTTFNKGVTNVSITASNICEPAVTTSFTVTVKDNEAPLMTNCPQPRTISCDASSDVLSMGYPSATDNCGAVSLSFSNESTQSADVNSAAHYNYTITRTFTATDMDDNTSSCVQVITVQDISAPSVSCVENAMRNTNAASCQYTVSGNEFDATASADNCSGVMLSYSLSGATTATGSGSLSGMVFNKGITSIQWTAMDVTGNSSSCSFDVTVSDNEAPVFTSCPQAMTINCDASTDVSNTGDAAATDNCGNVSISRNDVSTQDADVNSAAHYNYTITRTFTAKDEDNNSSICTQVITVQDITAPVMNCAENAMRNTNAASCEYVVSGNEFDAIACTDNCSGVTLSYVLSGATTATGSGSLSGMVLNKGTTSVNWTAMDVTGNSSACSFNVTVSDMEAPVIICPANMVVGTDPGACSALVNYSVTFSDNCTGAIMGQESGMPGGSTFPLGTTTNMFTVRDASGNTTSASFTVTVYDSELPVIVSIDKSNYSGFNVSCNGSCNGSASVNATDNCGKLTYVWSNSQTTAAITDLCAGTYTVTVSDGRNSVTAEVTITEPTVINVNAGGDAVTYFGYSANQAVIRTADVKGGVPPYSYRWSINRPLMCNMVTNAGDESMSSASWSTVTCPESPMNFTMAQPPICWGSPTVTATLMSDAVIYIIVMDANGCMATDSFTVAAEDVRCFAGNSTTAKVQMCHRTGSEKNPWITICVDASAVPEHLAHGDYVGSCNPARMEHSQSESASELLVYPNPNNGNFTLDFHSINDSKEDILVQVLSVAGNVVYSKTMSAADGHFNGLISTNDLEQGFYTVHVQQGEESINQTFVIMK